MLWLAACSDLGLPSSGLLRESELLTLPLRPEAPPLSAATFWVHNSRQTVRRVIHSDAENTPFLELKFPANSLAELGGTPLNQADSILVTVTPRAGRYGFSLSPNNLSFVGSNSPVATFFFGRYGDASVAAGSSTYSGPADYVAALDVWEEITVDQWRVARGSAAVGLDVVSGTVESPGQFLLAAPR